MKFKVVWIAGLLLAATSGNARAGFVNGSFENGLDGWTTSGSGSVSTTSSYDETDPEFFPVEGAQFAVLLGGEEGVYTTISQSFSATVGQELTGSAFFQSNDYVPFNDDGYVKILENGYVLFESSVDDLVGGPNFTAWTPFAYTFTSTGIYTIEAGVRNVLDGNLSSALGLDNVLLSSPAAVPEPASIAMWGLTSIGMMYARRRRQQRDLAK